MVSFFWEWPSIVFTPYSTFNFLAKSEFCEYLTPVHFEMHLHPIYHHQVLETCTPTGLDWIKFFGNPHWIHFMHCSWIEWPQIYFGFNFCLKCPFGSIGSLVLGFLGKTLERKMQNRVFIDPNLHSTNKSPKVSGRWTNTFSNLKKYILQCTQIYFITAATG